MKKTKDKSKNEKYNQTKSKIQTEKDSVNKDPTGQLNRGHGNKNQKR